MVGGQVANSHSKGSVNAVRATIGANSISVEKIDSEKNSYSSIREFQHVTYLNLILLG
jgi:hypothetical protein